LTVVSSYSPISPAAVRVLPPTVRSLILHSQSLVILIALATNKTRGRLIGELLAHLSWNDQAATETIISSAVAAIEEREYDEQRPHFCVLTHLLLARDQCRG
jgi:hypothetical protein